jgi:hypothetical protein
VSQNCGQVRVAAMQGRNLCGFLQNVTHDIEDHALSEFGFPGGTVTSFLVLRVSQRDATSRAATPDQAFHWSSSRHRPQPRGRQRNRRTCNYARPSLAVIRPPPRAPAIAAHLAKATALDAAAHISSIRTPCALICLSARPMNSRLHLADVGPCRPSHQGPPAPIS